MITPKTRKTSVGTQPNGIVMANCFTAEWQNAEAEKRTPTTSNVMALWNKTPNAKRLTPKQTNELFNIVLEAVLEVTGATAAVRPNPN
jgi:hypothetical protein